MDVDVTRWIVWDEGAQRVGGYVANVLHVLLMCCYSLG
jgi:hypothetical protein